MCVCVCVHAWMCQNNPYYVYFHTVLFLSHSGRLCPLHNENSIERFTEICTDGTVPGRYNCTDIAVLWLVTSNILIIKWFCLIKQTTFICTIDDVPHVMMVCSCNNWNQWLEWVSDIVITDYVKIVTDPGHTSITVTAVTLVHHSLHLECPL